MKERSPTRTPPAAEARKQSCEDCGAEIPPVVGAYWCKACRPSYAFDYVPGEEFTVEGPGTLTCITCQRQVTVGEPYYRRGKALLAFECRECRDRRLPGESDASSQP